MSVYSFFFQSSGRAEKWLQILFTFCIFPFSTNPFGQEYRGNTTTIFFSCPHSLIQSGLWELIGNPLFNIFSGSRFPLGQPRNYGHHLSFLSHSPLRSPELMGLHHSVRVCRTPASKSPFRYVVLQLYISHFKQDKLFSFSVSRHVASSSRVFKKIPLIF